MYGRTISHYEVTQWLGAGAMGDVYAARDTLLGRTVAIKVLQGEGVSEESRLRFLHEARAASALNHPNIITVHDVIRDGDADCIVMELIVGDTLGDHIDKGPIPAERTLEIVDRIADALSVAHSNGLVHRDLKPANVMITKSGHVKVLDFGLAKRTANFDTTPEAPALPRTQSGLIVGTPLYMSPEQVIGQPVDGRSDIFSLGTITAEMLTGRNPFDADSAIATMHQIAYGDMPALDGVPGSARRLIERMIHRDKTERFQTAEELRQAIAQVRAGQTLEMPEKPPAPAPSRAKTRWIAAGIAAVVLLTIAIGASQLWRTRAVASPTTVPVRAQETFKPPATAVDHVRRANELMSTYWRKGYVDKAVEEFQRAIAIDPQHAAAHAGLATAYWRKFDADDDRVWLDRAQKNARHAVELDPQLAAGRVALAMTELSHGNVDAAKKELAQTLVLDPANAAAHRWLGEVASKAKDARTAEAEFRKAIELRKEDAELHNALGSYFYRNARYTDAVPEFRSAIAAASDNTSGYRNLGAALHMLGDYSGAARAMQQSLEIEPNAIVYTNLGTLYFFQGLYPQSVTAYEKAVQLGATNHVMWSNLGDAYRWTPGNESKAREAFTTALNLLDDEIRKRPDDATLQTFRALYLAKRGDRPQALTAADGLVARKENNPQNLYFLALTFELAGAREKSLSALATAIRHGYSVEEIKADPEFASLRRDVQYQRMMVAVR